MVGGYNWNGNSPLNTFTPPYTPPSQPIIGNIDSFIVDVPLSSSSQERRIILNHGR